jgi:hypothetical protein
MTNNFFEKIANIGNSVVEYVTENPIKTASIVAATVVSGGVAYRYAPTIAGGIGKTGILGNAGTGRAINTLTGPYLKRASLAALGGGTLASGGGGMVAGATFVAYSGAAVGGVVATGVATTINDTNDKSGV